MANQCAHWCGNPPDKRDDKTMRLGQVFPRYHGIPTPSCGMVRDDTVYFVSAPTVCKQQFIVLSYSSSSSEPVSRELISASILAP